MHSNRLNLRFKLIALSLLGLIGMIITLGLFYSNISSALYEERKHEARRLIEAATGGLQYFHQLEQSGAMSQSEAKRQATKAIAMLRYGKNGYFWINDMDGIMIMHPFQSGLNGTNLLNTSDNQGIYLFREFVQKAERGGGWVKYNWPKPGDAEQWYSKVSYASPFLPWRWILGTGLYLDDINEEINQTTLNLGIIIFSIYAVMLIVTLLVANRFMLQLGELAIRDPLTSMFTRRHFMELAPMFISGHDRSPQDCLAAIFFDIDHFKHVNDSYGHDTGDVVLKAVGNTIAKMTRDSDMAIRYGGEEFVVIALSNRLDEAVEMAERIRSACAALSFHHNRDTFTITISAGLAERALHESMENLISRADQQLYLAKENGRDRLCISQAEKPESV
ncbi:diguanylate cyclase [Mariprofundus sp. NF]|uniref:diguanylate cyclase n=1 Tax=Mariprofundus sp. NF TaxID=2608716 RepID=UPI0015A2B513|nr:diguanylate cyclase [Mariprofundus sp. NF]NWF39114.1 diguanylate cyclase [Mariprofundus sp. NF]